MLYQHLNRLMPLSPFLRELTLPREVRCRAILFEGDLTFSEMSDKVELPTDGTLPASSCIFDLNFTLGE